MEARMYVAVLLYKSVVHINTPEREDALDRERILDYEESLTLVQGYSREGVFHKARQQGESRGDTYINGYGDTVVYSLEEVVDVAPVIDQRMGDLSKVYVRYFSDYESYWEFESNISGIEED